MRTTIDIEDDVLAAAKELARMQNVSAAQVAERLAEASASPDHEFWPADVNLFGNGVIAWQRMLGHRQVTDAYSLALAVQHGGRLVTLGRRVDPEAVRGARPEHLVALAAN